MIIREGPFGPKFNAETLVVSENVGEEARGGMFLFGEMV